jgi:hypothetical protein
MNLTKEDLEAIRCLIKEEVREEVRKVIVEQIEPLRKAFLQVLHAQVQIVDKLQLMDGNIKLIMFHLNLSPDSRNLRQTLKDLE